jgi:hypothetical protein
MKKYRGVMRRKTCAGTIRWQAAIMYRGKTFHIGNFDTPEEAAKAYYEVALKQQGDKAKLNLSGRLMTIREEQIYRLCHPDFFGLPQWAAAKLMHMSVAGIYYTLRHIKHRFPTLCWSSKAHECNTFSYHNWMDEHITMKF